jgi:hypothetical protein
VHHYQVYGGAKDVKKEVLSVAYSPSVQNLLLTGGGDSASRLDFTTFRLMADYDP